MLDGRFDHADGGQPGEARLARIAPASRPPVDGTRHHMTARLKAAMAVVDQRQRLDVIRRGAV